MIKLLDCTLRDGAYIVNSMFGVPAMKGIIKKLQNANIDLIECGWLKDSPHKDGSSFFHIPSDVLPYMVEKNARTEYVAMIDWNRYDVSALPSYDGKSIDAIRVVFPQSNFREGIKVGEAIREKGYKVYFQAANTLGYSDDDLKELAKEINKFHPVGVSVVDTFGAMYGDNLAHIIKILDSEIDEDIALGFHSHNNQQLSFSLSMQFVEALFEKRDIIVDSSLSGMGRGAGNTTTELLANYLNKSHNCNYDMNQILDAIDMYMGYFTEHYSWGYSTPYLISGMYCAHVNNIAYLTENHRTSAKDMRIIIEAMSEDDRKKYDYDLLENTYLDYQNKIVDDESSLNLLKDSLGSRPVLLISPGKSIILEADKVKKYINENNPVIIGVNAYSDEYKYDYLYFSNKVRYNYAKDVYSELMKKSKKIISSNVKTTAKDGEIIVNFNLLVKRGWEHFDNAVIMCLRLLNKLHIKEVALAGFDGFSVKTDDNYCDLSLPAINPGKAWDDLNIEIQDMFNDFRKTTSKSMSITFVTSSKYTDNSEENDD